jgi:integrase
MARSVRNAKLDTRSARAKCEVRREPHWSRMEAGAYIGYRRLPSGSGSWIARLRDGEGHQHYKALGSADDTRAADGLNVFDFGQAQELARQFFARKTRELAGHDAPQDGPFTIETAVRDYLTHRRRRGSKGVEADAKQAEARIIPGLAHVEVEKLTAKRIYDWLGELAESARRVRTAKTSATQATRDFDREDSEEIRKRRSTANRVLTILKASLNYAFVEGRTTSDLAWRRVRPFRGVDAARIRFLSTDEARRLCNACEPDFRALVQGALATGARYGELIRLCVADFKGEADTVTIRESKTSRARHVALASEGAALFRAMTAGKCGEHRIFIRADGDPWAKSHQARPIAEASRRASIKPFATFHILRHTYGSALAMEGVPMAVIAKAMGHRDTRMTEKHYAHLSPNYVDDTIRAKLPALADFKPDDGIVSLAARRTA